MYAETSNVSIARQVDEEVCRYRGFGVFTVLQWRVAGYYCRNRMGRFTAGQGFFQLITSKSELNLVRQNHGLLQQQHWI